MEKLNSQNKEKKINKYENLNLLDERIENIVLNIEKEIFEVTQDVLKEMLI